MRNKRPQLLVWLLGGSLLLGLGSCAPETTDGTIPDPDYGTGSVLVTPETSLVTNENGAGAQFSVVLGSATREEVVVRAEVAQQAGAATELLFDNNANTKEFLFTAQNWQTPQTLLVRGVDDFTVDGDQTVQLTFSVITADPAYNNATIAPFDIVNQDTTIAGVEITTSNGGALSPATLSVTEYDAGHPDYREIEFRVKLLSKPSAEVLLTPDNLSEGTDSLLAFTPAQLSFDSANWNAEQTMLVSARQNTAREGDQTLAFSLVTSSADSHYDNRSNHYAGVERIDDETPGLIFPSSVANTSEDGARVTIPVHLRNIPEGTVEVILSVSDASEATIIEPAPVGGVHQLTFTVNAWDVDQEIVLQGVDDDLSSNAPGGDNGQFALEVQFRSDADADYNTESAAVLTLTNDDNDAPGFVVTPADTRTSESGDCAYVRVKLQTDPGGDVRLRPTLDSAEEIAVSTACPSLGGNPCNSELSFNSTNWNQSQILCFLGQDDSVIDDVQQVVLDWDTSGSIVPYSDLANLPRPLALYNVDDDYPALRINPLLFSYSLDTYQLPIQLSAQPSGNVTVAASLADLVPNALHFDETNWNVPQTFSFPENLNGTFAVTFAISSTSTDERFRNLLPESRTFTLQSDNRSELPSFVSIFYDEGSISNRYTTEEGGSFRFAVQLSQAPASAVALALNSSDLSAGTLDRGSLLFDSTNWNVPQEVVVTGVDRPTVDRNVAYEIEFDPASSSDTNFHQLRPQNISLVHRATTTVSDAYPSKTFDHDNQTCSSTAPSAEWFVITSASNTTYEENPAYLDNVTVRLANDPQGVVNFTAYSSDDSEGEIVVGGTSVFSQSLSFNTSNWNIPQTIRVRGVNDAYDDGNVRFNIQFSPITGTSSNYIEETPPPVCLVNVDDEVAGFEATPSQLVLDEGGDNQSITVRLFSEPTHPVTLSYNLDAPSATGVSLAENAVTLDQSNWGGETITLLPTADAATLNQVNGNEPFTLVFTAVDSRDQHYQDQLTALFATQNTLQGYQQDDDVNDLLLTLPETPVVNETSGQATFTVALRSQPSSEVLLSVAALDQSEGEASPALLLFDADNWDLPQEVRVRGVDDYEIDGDQQFDITLQQTNAPAYLNAERTVRFLNLDTTQAGFLVNALDERTSENNDIATIQVRLRSRPTAEVILGNVSTSNSAEGIVETGSLLTFTTTNWSQPQTVTVRGLPDNQADGNAAYQLIFDAAESDDPNYQGLTPDAVNLLNLDVD